MTANEKPSYSMIIRWSSIDNKYLVTLPEWKGEVQHFVTHGDTYEEAAKNGREILEMLIENADGDLPTPREAAYVWTEDNEELYNAPDEETTDLIITGEDNDNAERYQIAAVNKALEKQTMDKKWDELLNSPESHAFLDKLSAEAKADQATGNLIPGGFDGVGEFTDELESAVKALIGKVQEGMMERDQHEVAGFINEAIACVTVDRYKEDEVEIDPYEDTAEDVFDEIGTIVERAGMFMGFGVTTANNKNVLRKYAEQIKEAIKRLDVAIEKQIEVSEEEWKKPFMGLNFRRRVKNDEK